MRYLVGAALLLSLPATAQEALYGAQPPAGSAYVRFANATAAPIEMMAPGLPNQTMDTTDATRITPYAVVEKVAGRKIAASFRTGGHTSTAELTVAPDGFATVLLRTAPDGGVMATVALEGADFNQAKARLSFYNATPSCPAAGVSVVPAGTAVFADIAAGSSKSRSVNPVTATIRAACTGAAAPDLALSGMEVGGSYSVWLMQPAGQSIAFVSRDATLPYKR